MVTSKLFLKRINMYTKSDSGWLNCGCVLLVLAFNVTVGAWSVNFLLDFFLNKTVPFIGAAVIGLFTAQLTVPVAIVVWILQLFNVL